MSKELNVCVWCRDRAHAGACDRESLKRVISEMRVLEAARSKLPGTNVIMIRSLISHRNQKPRIDIQLGEIHTQMDAAAAIDVARNIFQVAAGANADAFIFHFMKEKLEIDDARAGMVISEFRDYREALEREFENYQSDRSSEE